MEDEGLVGTRREVTGEDVEQGHAWPLISRAGGACQRIACRGRIECRLGIVLIAHAGEIASHEKGRIMTVELVAVDGSNVPP